MTSKETDGRVSGRHKSSACQQQWRRGGGGVNDRYGDSKAACLSLTTGDLEQSWTRPTGAWHSLQKCWRHLGVIFRAPRRRTPGALIGAA